jgi:hypothetical protein
MKKSFFMMILCCTLMACSKPTAAQESTMENGIEVLYFHTNQRCATCIAIEENAKSVVENLFAAQCANGDVVFRSVKITHNQYIENAHCAM